MYAVLKNGIVMHHTDAGTTFRIIEMLFEKFHARMLLTFAEELCPEAVPQIEEESGFLARYTNRECGSRSSRYSF
jgi:hypothetical protein